MRTLRLSLTGAVILVLLGGLGGPGGVVGQSGEPTDQAIPYFYTCTSFDHGGVIDEGTMTPTEAGYAIRGYTGGVRSVSDDPRAAGDGVYVHSQDSFDGTPWGMGPRWGSSSSANAVGGWEGTYLGAMVPTAEGDFIYVIVGRYRGTGGYQGLSQIDITSYPDGPGGMGYCQGVIYEGELPPDEYVPPPAE
jgi:hypothetical protein